MLVFLNLLVRHAKYFDDKLDWMPHWVLMLALFIGEVFLFWLAAGPVRITLARFGLQIVGAIAFALFVFPGADFFTGQVLREFGLSNGEVRIVMDRQHACGLLRPLLEPSVAATCDDPNGPRELRTKKLIRANAADDPDVQVFPPSDYLSTDAKTLTIPKGAYVLIEQ